VAAVVAADRAAGLTPWVVVANGGATNTGAVDPLDALADVAARESLWLHVDAAYGWAAVLSNEQRRLLAGIGRADSVTLDPHKWFAQTYDAGCLLVRQRGLLEASFADRADYLADVTPTAGEVNFADRGLALSRRFRALKIWLSVKAYGLRWFRGLIDHGCALAELAELLLRDAGFEIAAPRSLSIVCFRLVSRGSDEGRVDQLNSDLAAAVRRTGRAFVAVTRFRGRTVLRLCFVNWRTRTADVDEVVALLAAAAEEIRGS
jgi:glutamate/tyrosine decarboxylase-like PLP-dependent enzyme